MKNTVDILKSKSYSYRKRFLELFTNLGFGHVTSAFSWTEIATVLFHEIMNREDGGDFSDKIVVSKGHGAGILFPILEDLGFFSKEEMQNTIRIGGSSEKLRKYFYPGFDFYGGSLGIGLGCATGLAKYGKITNAPWRVFCVVGDAECYEGAIWEAIIFAGFNKLDNLVLIVDRNRMGCSDFTEHMLALEPFKEKFTSFNWDVCCVDGHSIEDLYGVLSSIKHNEKPHCIIADTKKGKGLDYLIDNPLNHGYMPKGIEISLAFKNLK